MIGKGKVTVEQKTAQKMRAEIARYRSKIETLQQQRVAREEQLAHERAALRERDTATLEKLATLKLDVDLTFGDVSFPKVPGATNAGPALLNGLQAAREALPIVLDTVAYRIENGTGPDSELAQIDDLIGRARAALQVAEQRFAEARAAAEAWLLDAAE